VVVYTGRFERMGGSDFNLPAGATGTIEAALMDNWETLLSASGYPDAATFLWLLGPGDEPLIAGGGPLALSRAP
jgi:hypothetical protein